MLLANFSVKNLIQNVTVMTLMHAAEMMLRADDSGCTTAFS